MKYKFKNYVFDDESQLLRRPDRSQVWLREQAGALLTALLRRPGELVPKEELISSVWSGTSFEGDKGLHKTMSELKQQLNDKNLIKSRRNRGYVLDIEPSFVSTEGTLRPPSIDQPQGAGLSKTLLIFPGQGGMPAGETFIHSAIAFGANDYVKHISERLSWEEKPRHNALLSPVTPSTLMFPVRHHVDKRSVEDSWWSVSIPVKINYSDGRWDSENLSTYRSMAFEARASGINVHDSKGTKLLVRLEDNSSEAKNGSRRQSTDWHPSSPTLTDSFASFEFALDRWKWSAAAFPGNTKAPNRNAIAQITLGQDASVPEVLTTIEVRNVRFLR